MVTTNRTPFAGGEVLRAMSWIRCCVIIALIPSVITVAANPISVAHATDAGVDGDHIYAGVSYDSLDTFAAFDSCEWMLPVSTYLLGARAGLTTREWNGIMWLLYECERDGRTTLIWLPDVSVESVAESSRNLVSELVPTLEEGFSPSPRKGLVKTPTWFWVNPLMWRPVSVTARVPTPRGIISITTTATPESLEFHPGDGRGDTVECDGPGLPWSPILPAFIQSECQYEYPIPSTIRQDGVFRARLDVVWSITWRTNVGTSGRLPDLRLGSTHSVRIRELQAVLRK